MLPALPRDHSFLRAALELFILEIRVLGIPRKAWFSAQAAKLLLTNASWGAARYTRAFTQPEGVEVGFRAAVERVDTCGSQAALTRQRIAIPQEDWVGDILLSGVSRTCRGRIAGVSPSRRVSSSRETSPGISAQRSPAGRGGGAKRDPTETVARPREEFQGEDE